MLGGGVYARQRKAGVQDSGGWSFGSIGMYGKKTHPMRENEREKIKQSVIFCVLSLLLLSRETDTVTLGAYMPTKVPGMTLCIK